MKFKTSKPTHDTHGKPLTRREFLGRSATGFTAFAMGPTLLGMLLKEQMARAGETDPLAAAPLPFIVFDCVGGAALPGNFLVGNKGGPEDLITSYSTLGWNPRAADSLDMQFGLPMSKNMSQILRGINTAASAQARAGLRMSSLCHAGQDDTSANILSAVSLVLQSGTKGAYIKNFLGLNSSESGGNSRAVAGDKASGAVFIKSLDDILDSTRISGMLATAPKKWLDLFSKSGQAINSIFAKNIAGHDEGKKFGDQHMAFFGRLGGDDASSALDPRKNAKTQTIYGINQNTQANQRPVLTAGMVMGSLLGNTGPAVISIGGCDYHVGNQTTGDQKDLEIGTEIGRAVELAYQLQKPFFFQLLTDGGISSAPDTRNWSGESGSRSMTVMGMYNPVAPAKQRRLQVGAYTNGQIASLDTLVGGSTSRVGAAVFANYLDLQGRVGEFSSIAPSGLLSSADLDSVLCFEKAQLLTKA